MKKTATVLARARAENASEAAARIATEVCGIETLARRCSDRLDFHDLAVWTIERALVAAFEAGRAAAGGK